MCQLPRMASMPRFSRELEPAPFAIAGIHPETRIRHTTILSMFLSCSILGLWEINVPSDGVIGVGILTSSWGLRWNWLWWCRICWSWASRFGKGIRRR